jgi:hypothetical protein
MITAEKKQPTHFSVGIPSTSSVLHEYAPRCSQQYESMATRLPLYASPTCIVLVMDFSDGSKD